VTDQRSPPTDTSFDNPHKRRHGLARLWYALRHSFEGLRAGWAEKAFRLEAHLSLVLLPLAFWLGRSWVEVALLVGSVVAVLVVELLNTAVESAIDRVGPQWHALSKRAKDLGSAAVLLALLFCGGVWVAALLARFN
jgi:diacylglycerol kinase (ATP)